jgi:hypothetical protein
MLGRAASGSFSLSKGKVAEEEVLRDEEVDVTRLVGTEPEEEPAEDVDGAVLPVGCDLDFALRSRAGYSRP